MKFNVLFFAMLSCFVLSGTAQSNKVSCGGCWSRNAVSLSNRYDSSTKAGRTLEYRIKSPDGTKSAIVIGAFLYLEVGDHRIKSSRGVNFIAEIKWSPDSKAFFVTQSDGGSIGTYYVDVFLAGDENLTWVNPAKTVEKDFKKQYTCQSPETPNIGAVSWIGTSDKLLLIAQVPPHSTCPKMGSFFGYAVSIPSGQILNTYSEKDIFSRWHHKLGGYIRRVPHL
ncbi:MAG: hypothetical protein JWO13_2003 [Acidobacteriales bacterium]|nr:hypothetical protein [Terriglobales bacterium]